MSQTKNLSLLLLAAGMATAGGLGLDESHHGASKRNVIEVFQTTGNSDSQSAHGQASWVRRPWTAAAAPWQAASQ